MNDGSADSSAYTMTIDVYGPPVDPKAFAVRGAETLSLVLEELTNPDDGGYPVTRYEYRVKRKTDMSYPADWVRLEIRTGRVNPNRRIFVAVTGLQDGTPVRQRHRIHLPGTGP